MLIFNFYVERKSLNSKSILRKLEVKRRFLKLEILDIRLLPYKKLFLIKYNSMSFYK